MATTPFYGFDVVDPDDTSRLLIEWIQTVFGPDTTSTIMQLDSILHDIAAGAESFKIVESAEEPTDINIGDEWDKLL